MTAPFSGEIQRFFSSVAPVEEHYWFDVDQVTTDDEPPGLAMEISRCGPCEDVIRNWGDDYEWQFPLLGALKAGRYSLEIRLPADFSGQLQLSISR